MTTLDFYFGFCKVFNYAVKLVIETQSLKEQTVREINILNKEDPDTNSYLNILMSLGFQHFITKPTRVQNDLKTCIDHFFVKTKTNLKKSINFFIFEEKFTDHFPISCHIERQIENIEKQKKHIQDNKINFKELQRKLQDEKWQKVTETQDADQAYTQFQ